MKLGDIGNLDKDDVLALLGLERRAAPSARIAETLGTFGLGLLVGAGIALVLAPKPGRELRDDLRDRWRRQSTDGAGAGSAERG